MRPLKPPPGPKINFDKCVLYKDGNTLGLAYWLVTELKFQTKFHKIDPHTGILVAALWDHAFRGEVLNVKKTIIIEFEDQAGIEFLTNHLPNRAVSFLQLPVHQLEPKLTVRH